MVLKTFNVDKDNYSKFSSFCKEHGISMSKQIDIFMGSVVEEDPETKKEYLKKLDIIRKQKSFYIGSISDFDKKYGLK